MTFSQKQVWLFLQQTSMPFLRSSSIPYIAILKKHLLHVCENSKRVCFYRTFFKNERLRDFSHQIIKVIDPFVQMVNQAILFSTSIHTHTHTHTYTRTNRPHNHYQSKTH